MPSHAEEFATEWAALEKKGEADAAGGSEWRSCIAMEICRYLGKEPTEDRVYWIEDLLWYVQRLEGGTMNGDDDVQVTIKLTLEVDSDTDVQALARRLFDLLADDPMDLFPSIMAVIDYEVEQS